MLPAQYVEKGLCNGRVSVCPIDRQRTAGLLLGAHRATRTSYRSPSTAGARARQQMRVALCWEPTEEAQHRLDLTVISSKVDVIGLYKINKCSK